MNISLRAIHILIPMLFTVMLSGCDNSDNKLPQAATAGPTSAAAGDQAIEAVKTAILHGDADALSELVSYVSRSCTSTGPSEPGRVLCPGGVPVGSSVETFFAGACGEGAFVVKGTPQVRGSLEYLVKHPMRLHSIIEGSIIKDIPGHATLIFTASAGNEAKRARAAVVDDKGLVAYRFDCGIGVAGLVGANPKYIMPPTS